MRSLTVRLRQVVRVGEPLKVRATLLMARRRVLELEALATSPMGELVATASAKFLRVGEGERW